MSGTATQISFGAAEHVTASFFEQKAGKVRMFYRNEERETHVEHQSEYNLINASQIRELADDKLLIISNNRKTTLIDVYPSHKSARWLRMMRLPLPRLPRLRRTVWCLSRYEPTRFQRHIC